MLEAFVLAQLSQPPKLVIQAPGRNRTELMHDFS